MAKKTILHINMHHIRWNQSHDDKKPVITIKKEGQNIYCNKVKILGPSEIVYTPDKPLACGARVYLTTTSEVIAEDAVFYEEINN